MVVYLVILFINFRRFYNVCCSQYTQKGQHEVKMEKNMVRFLPKYDFTRGTERHSWHTISFAQVRN